MSTFCMSTFFLYLAERSFLKPCLSKTELKRENESIAEKLDLSLVFVDKKAKRVDWYESDGMKWSESKMQLW